MIFLTYFFIMKMIYSHISFTYMFVPTWFDAALVFLYTICLGGNKPAFSLPTYHNVKFFMPLYIMQIYMIVHTFFFFYRKSSIHIVTESKDLFWRYVILFCTDLILTDKGVSFPLGNKMNGLQEKKMKLIVRKSKVKLFLS